MSIPVHDYPFTTCSWCGPVATVVHHDGTSTDRSVIVVFVRPDQGDPDSHGTYHLQWRCPRCHRQSRTEPITGQLMVELFDMVRARTLAIEYQPHHPDGMAPDAITGPRLKPVDLLRFAHRLTDPHICVQCDLHPDPMPAHDAPLCLITEAEEPRYGDAR